MKFILEITCDGAAFQPDGVESPQQASAEVARILRHAAACVETEGVAVNRLRDINGNRVGGFEFSDDAPVCGF